MCAERKKKGRQGSSIFLYDLKEAQQLSMGTNEVTGGFSWTNHYYSHCTLNITGEIVPVFVRSQSCDEKNRGKRKVGNIRRTPVQM